MKIARRFQRRVTAEREEPRPRGTPEFRSTDSWSRFNRAYGTTQWLAHPRP